MRIPFKNSSFPSSIIHPRSSPRGGALLFILIITTALFICILTFIHFIDTSQKDALLNVFNAACDTGIESAAAHAETLLHTDVHVSESDSPKDIWVTVPRQKPVTSRIEWHAYISNPTNLHKQHWFYLPGPTPATQIRYRMKIIDGYESSDVFTHAQPFTPVARNKGRWLPTQDINALSRNELAHLLSTFDAQGTSMAWRTRISAQLIDDRDANNILCDTDVPDTEALHIETVVHNEDTRWIPADDLYRLGRYYEMRPNHNYFLVESAQTNNDGTVTVTLDSEPLIPVVGWDKYKDMRSAMSASRWPPHLFDNTPAATGSGDIYKEQKIIKNTDDTLIFNDNLLDRYAENNGVRQTVTLKGWFSSLNTWMRAWLPSCKEKGVFATFIPGVSDSFSIMNLPAQRSYRLSCFTGRTSAAAPPMQLCTERYNSLQKTAVQKNGFETGASPQHITARENGDTTQLEIFFRSPNQSVSQNNPFYIYGFLLEQPEYVVIRNTSDEPVSLRGYRLGIQMGVCYSWTAPFTTAFWYRARGSGKHTTDAPVVPAQGKCVITPDAALFDLFMGITKDGVWGSSEKETIPVIETGWESWGPHFAVSRARPGKSVSQYGPSSFRLYPWSTEWRLHIPALREYDTPHILTNECVLFDPDGDDGEKPAVPGIITDAKKGFVTVVLNGSRDAYSPNDKATLQFRGIPRGAGSILCVTPDGQPVAYIRKPVQRIQTSENTARVYNPREGVREMPFTWNTLHTRLYENSADEYRTVHNKSYSSPAEKAYALQKNNVSIAHDWFVPSACFAACSNAVKIIPSHLSCIPDTFLLKRTEAHNFTLSPNEFQNFFPAGIPGNLYSTLYIDSDPMPLHIARISTDGIRTRAFSRSIPYRKSLTATCVPFNTGGGIHLSGPPGSVTIEWKNLPKTDGSFTLTLAGRATRTWTPPRTASLWHAGTNSPVYLSCDIWNPFTRSYDTAHVKATFDESERIDLGTFPALYLHNGTVRLRIHTHEQCQPGLAEVWLHGIYVYPFSPRTYVNINTAPVSDILSICHTNRALLSALLHGDTGQFSGLHVYKSVADVITALDMSEKYSELPPNISTRSDIFTVFIESHVVNTNKDDTIPLASRTRTFTLSREKSRVHPGIPVSRYIKGSQR